MNSVAPEPRAEAEVAARAQRLGNLDVLRAVAALMVVAAHANYWNASTRAPDGALRHYMWSGVNLFFVLSGYLITRPFIMSLCRGVPISGIRSYAVRRAARILPAYWVVLAVSLLVSRPFTATWYRIAVHVALIQNSVPGETFAMVDVAWTLGIEAMFYILVPLGALAIGRRRGVVAPARVAVIVVCVWVLSAAWSWSAATYGSAWLGGAGEQAINAAGDSAPAILTVNLPAKLFLFCPGILIALGDCTGALRRFSLAQTAMGRALMALVAGLTWCTGAIADWGRSTPLSRAVRDELFAVAFGLLLVVALQAKPWRSTLARIVASIGVVSYGLYLWHGFAEEWLRALTPLPTLGGGTTMWLLATAVITMTGLVPSILSWGLLERPLIGLATRAYPARAAAMGSVRNLRSVEGPLPARPFS